MVGAVLLALGLGACAPHTSLRLVSGHSALPCASVLQEASRLVTRSDEALQRELLGMDPPQGPGSRSSAASEGTFGLSSGTVSTQDIREGEVTIRRWFTRAPEGGDSAETAVELDVSLRCVRVGDQSSLTLSSRARLSPHGAGALARADLDRLRRWVQDPEAAEFTAPEREPEPGAGL